MTGTGRILTTHAGSLPRPKALAELYLRNFRGEPVDPALLEREGRAALDWVVGKQIDAGLDVLGNGEQQRSSFVLHMKSRLAGLGGTWSKPDAQPSRYPEFDAIAAERETRRGISHRQDLPMATGEVRYADPALARREPADFRQALEPHKGAYVDAFITVPSPGYLTEIVKNAHYDTNEAYLDAMAAALRVEYEAIVAAGFQLQIDAPYAVAPRPADQVGYIERTVAAMNSATAGLPQDRIRYHFCWGNSDSPHDQDIPLETILPALRQARVGYYVLPFANPRHAHEHRYLGDLLGDTGKKVVAGVIDVTTNYVEHPEVIVDRLKAIARSAGDPSRVVAGTDCGFSTSIGASQVAPDVAWAKIGSLVEGARRASRHLFGGSA